jgi:hypothetical protein
MDYYNKMGTDIMSNVRYLFLEQNIEHFDSICDFGYGNGAFLRFCNTKNKTTYGYDISDYPLPAGTTRIHDIDSVEVDVMTFFDSIEHIEDPDLVTFLKTKKTKYVVISLPWFHEFQGAAEFKKWKHRKQNEHFHHFDVHGLVGLLHDSNYEVLNVSNMEDCVRKSVNYLPNILTVIAKKK